MVTFYQDKMQFVWNFLPEPLENDLSLNNSTLNFYQNVTKK